MQIKLRKKEKKIYISIYTYIYIFLSTRLLAATEKKEAVRNSDRFYRSLDIFIENFVIITRYIYIHTCIHTYIHTYDIFCARLISTNAMTMAVNIVSEDSSSDSRISTGVHGFVQTLSRNAELYV